MQTIVLSREEREEVEIQLDRWCATLERRGMKISWTKTEYLALNGNQNDKIEQGGVGISEVRNFKYLG